MVMAITEDRATRAPFQQPARPEMLLTYRVEVEQDLLDEQGQLIDWLIGFAFETVGTHVLDLRVRPAESDLHR